MPDGNSFEEAISIQQRKVATFRQELAILAGGAQKFERQEQLRVAEAELVDMERGHTSRRLKSALETLDFAPQARTFKRLLDMGKQMAAVFICGDVDQGAHWLWHRLTESELPAATRARRIDKHKHNFAATTVDHSPEAVLKGIARKLSVRVSPGQDLHAAVAARLRERSASGHFIIVFKCTEMLGPAGLDKLMTELWEPIVRALGAAPGGGAGWILAFFVHHGPPPTPQGKPLAHPGGPGAPGVDPTIPIGLPPLKNFDADLLRVWADTILGGPAFLNDDQTLADIVAQYGGRPRDVCAELCDRWPADWEFENEWSGE